MDGEMIIKRFFCLGWCSDSYRQHSILCVLYFMVMESCCL